MTRSVSVCVAALIAMSSVANAEIPATGTLPGTAVLNINKYLIKDADGEFNEPVDPDARRFSLNRAHCECAKAMAGDDRTFKYEITITGSTPSPETAEFWVGTNCANNTERPMSCRKITDIQDINALATAPRQIELSVFDLTNPTAALQMMDCVDLEGSAKLWMMVDQEPDNTFEYYKAVDVAQTETNMDVTTVDTKAPPIPTGFRASSGEESIEISWTVPTDRPADIYAYQALCMDENGEPVASIDPLYQTSTQLCGEPTKVGLTEVDAGDGTVVTLAPEFATLDTRFICGETTAPTASSLTIREVENGKPYRVALLVIDKYGNVGGVYFNRTVIPKPVTDLWEDINDRNSAIDGGCLLSQTYGEGNPLTQVLRSFRDTTLARTAYGRALTRAYYATLGKIDVTGSIVLRVLAAIYLLPLVIIALLWHGLTLPGMLALFALLVFWRRLRWRLRLRMRTLAVVVVLVPTIASADDFTPYWDTQEDEDASLIDFPEVKWHVGVRVGPYIPDIDLQLGLNAATGMGPYEAMFGDYYTEGPDTNGNGMVDADERVKHDQRVWQILPMLDVDRVLWDGFGQVTVGGSLGYMQKSGYAYLDGTSADDPKRLRSSSSKNTFRMIPLAAVVGYRFTALDDMYGIPIVPYVKGGISYYAWWIKSPSGNVSKVCTDMSIDGMCQSFDKAYGGSLGFQGSVGLAIRAERIDAAAATSMRSSGIIHAGFYAELSYAKVDGFGSGSKLSVGDNTWFAGVNFEF